MKRSLGPVVVSSFAIGAGVLLSAQVTQQEQPTFRAAVNYVEVPVRVFDAKGSFVRGLTANDFTVQENGTRQTIVRFGGRDIAAGVVGITGNARPLVSREAVEAGDDLVLDADVRPESRVFVFLVDDLFLGSGQSLRVRQLLSRFLSERMSDVDLGAIALTSRSRSLELTPNRDRLQAALADIGGLHEAAIDDHPAIAKAKTRRVRAMIEAVSRALATISDRRKALIVISPHPEVCDVRTDFRGRLAEDTDPMPITCGMMFEAAVRSGVSLYMLDPRGTAIAPACITAEFSGEGCGRGDVRRVSRAWSTQQSGIRTLAEETGGFAMMMSNNFNRFFDRIVVDNSAYYLIGYYSSDDRADGRLRSHQIKVNRAGLNVSHRAGYVAPRR